MPESPPPSISVSSHVEGDETLAHAALQAVSSDDVYALTVAAVTPDQVELATVNAPLDATFEIGSVTKGVTGMLYVDALDRGEIAEYTTLGQVLGLQSLDAADITLGELSQHCSGLPRLPIRLRDRLRMMLMIILARNPTNVSAEDIPQLLDAVGVGEKIPRYSNLGFAALGHALAQATETEYPELVRRRIAEPLGLPNFYVPVDGQNALDRTAAQGRDSSGRAQQPWTASGYAPAGGIRADAASMASLARELLDGSAPGARALTPTADFLPSGSMRIGAGWMTSEFCGRPITWHNGGTGGFMSWFGLDRERGNAIFLAGATGEPLDTAGKSLLAGLSSS